MKPIHDRDGITIYNADCLDVLPELLDGSVDLILTDPPYNVSARGVGGRANTTIGRVTRRGVRPDGTSSHREIVRDFGAWDHEWDPKPFLDESRRLIRPGGGLVAFTSEFLFAPYLCSGLDHRSLLYWRKSNPAPNFRGQVVRAVEMAVWQTQGGAWTFNAGGYRPNVWEGPILSGYSVVNNDEARVHPTQKPLWLMREWIELFSKPGDLILDPFMGSGTTLRAAADCGRRAIGIELHNQISEDGVDRRYCDAAIERLRQGVLL